MTDADMNADVAALLQRVRAQADQVRGIQREVEALRITASSPGGEVTVTVCGTGRLTEVVIDPDAVRRRTARDLGDLVLAAVNDGLRTLAEASAARFAPVIEAAARIEQ